jgi:putative flavoprotein involved in K+ transport
MVEQVETVIVGAGQAGLAMSYWLTAAGREHIVLERGRVGERWRSERWDSLTVLAQNWTVTLPGRPYAGADPDGFMGKDEVAAFIDAYANQVHAPVRTGVTVRELRQSADSKRCAMESDAGGVEAKNVVVATGPYQQPSIPAWSTSVAGDVFQVHSSQYRNPAQLPAGAVLIVGSSSSGQQIAEELLAAQRRVYLSVGGFRRARRRYRGNDSTWWQQQMGNFDQVVAAPGGKRHTPALTGVGGGHDLDLREMAADGMTLLGRLRGADNARLQFAPDLADTMAAADADLAERLTEIDRYIAREGLALPAESPWEYRPEPKELADPILELDLEAAGVGVIVWATGFHYAFDWIRLPAVDGAGQPVHQRGVTTCPGIYFLGLQGLHKVKSSFIMGVGEDAAYLAEHIAARS